MVILDSGSLGGGKNSLGREWGGDNSLAGDGDPRWIRGREVGDTEDAALKGRLTKKEKKKAGLE